MNVIETIKVWKTVVWLDEKRFTPYGTDGLAYHWHDLRNDPHWFIIRHKGGVGTMVWRDFCLFVVQKGHSWPLLI